jgi:3-oxoadipyl-CoA thiolase
MNTAYVVDAVRTPIGKYGGALATVRPDDLAALTIRALMMRNPSVDSQALEEVILGAANQSGEDNRNAARMAALLADLPESVAGTTVNRLCASGLQAIIDASRAIQCGQGDLYLAGGAESMSRAPYVLGKSTVAFDRGQTMYDTTMGWRFINPELSARHYPYTMGETAEQVARRYQVSREDQDLFALQSQQRYQQAFNNGYFQQEIIPVTVAAGKGATLEVIQDEHPRMTSLEKLAQLKPAFVKDGTVTAGNSSGINDGAAMLLLASDKGIKDYSLNPMARIVQVAVAGVEPAVMGIGPVPAVRKLLQRAGLTIADIGLFELNEAFAAQSVACLRELQLDPEKVNIQGGAIALGHPLGCSGARISATLLYAMQRKNIRYGIATLCVGVGQGVAVLYENMQ